MTRWRPKLTCCLIFCSSGEGDGGDPGDAPGGAGRGIHGPGHQEAKKVTRVEGLTKFACFLEYAVMDDVPQQSLKATKGAIRKEAERRIRPHCALQGSRKTEAKGTSSSSSSGTPSPRTSGW